MNLRVTVAYFDAIYTARALKSCFLKGAEKGVFGH